MFGQLTPDVPIEVHAQEMQGRNVVVIGNDVPWGLIAIADTVRQEAASSAAQLMAFCIACDVLLSCDNSCVSTMLGQELDVDVIRAELLSPRKFLSIKEL